MRVCACVCLSVRVCGETEDLERETECEKDKRSKWFEELSVNLKIPRVCVCYVGKVTNVIQCDIFS